MWGKAEGLSLRHAGGAKLGADGVGVAGHHGVDVVELGERGR
jgi:hypothetical protein